MTGTPAADPAFAAALGAAAAAIERGDSADARRRIGDLVEQWPDAPQSWHLAAVAAERATDWPAAASAWSRIAKLAPSDATAMHRLGMALQRAGDLDRAVRALRNATMLDPDRPSYFNALGLAEQAAGRLDAAKEAFSAAARRAPSAPEPLNNLGGIAVALGDPLGAIGYYRQSIRAAPERWSAHYNLGNVLLRLDRLDEAVEPLRDAVRLAPERPAPHANLAMALLGLGRDAEGWKEFLWRIAAPRPETDRPRVPLPDRLDGERILLQNEQGIGDALFYLRYAPVLAARGAILQHDPYRKAASLLARVPWLAAPGSGEAAPTRRVPFADLPFLAAADRANPYPPPLPIAPLDDRRRAVADRLAAAGPGPYLAVTWQAGVDDGIATLKRVPPDALGAALRGWPGTVVMVQRAPVAADRDAFAAALGRAPADFADLNEALEDMLVLLDLVAEYATVSNTNVHLRAGLGRPSRVLVPFPPEFRWRSRDVRSPWFPDCPVYREAADGGWTAALGGLAADLVNPAGGAGTRDGAAQT